MNERRLLQMAFFRVLRIWLLSWDSTNLQIILLGYFVQFVRTSGVQNFALPSTLRSRALRPHSLEGLDIELSYRGPTRPCSNQTDCRGTGEICRWLYEGCRQGHCTCQPTPVEEELKFRLLDVYLKDLDASSVDPIFCYNSSLFQNTTFNGSCGPQGFNSNGSLRPVEGWICPKDHYCDRTLGLCRCVDPLRTFDGRYGCLQTRHRLIGSDCDPSYHECLQITADGYSKNDVTCRHNGRCACANGYKEDGRSCRKRKIGEMGCYTSYHCESGALCIDNRCLCPSGFHVPQGYSKCVKLFARINLGLGEICDEINENEYCDPSLVCHKCDKESPYRCVRFLLHEQYILQLKASGHMISGKTKLCLQTHLLNCFLVIFLFSLL